MNWLFGCFGGVAIKARKHAASHSAFQSLPVKVVLPSSIAASGFVSKEEEIKASNGEVLPRERNGASFVPYEDTHLQETSERTPKNLKKDDPLSQLDDLEEELEDLRKQIEQETLDTQQIKDEVTFLRSCGTLLQTPAELKKRDKAVKSKQDGTPSKRWHSWLLQSSCTPSKRLCNVSSESRYAHEGMEPIFCPADVVQGQQPTMVQNAKDNCAFASKSSFKLQHGPLPQNIQRTKLEVDSDIGHPSLVPALGHKWNDCVVNSTLLTDHPGTPYTNGVAEKATRPENNRSIILTNHSLQYVGDSLLDSARDDSQYVQSDEDTMSMQGDQSHTRKMFEILPETMSDKTSELQEFSEERNDIQQKVPRFSKFRYHMYESSDYSTEMVPQSPCTVGMTQSEGCQTSTCHVNRIDKKQFSRKDDGLGHTPSLVNGYNSSLKASISPSTPPTTSEETLTASSTEESLSLLESPWSHVESITSCTVEERSSYHAGRRDRMPSYSHGSTQNSVMQASRRPEHAAKCGFKCHENEDDFLFGDIISCKVEDRLSTCYSTPLTQNSVAQASGRPEHVANYGFKCSESEDDVLFSDLCSRVSTRCNHSQNTGADAKGKFTRRRNQDLIKTPNKMIEWQDSPELSRSSCMRNRPSSPVLTPVESAHQWRRLKRKEPHLTKNFIANGLNNAKTETDHHHAGDLTASMDTSVCEDTPNQEREESWDGSDEPQMWGSKGYLYSENERIHNYYTRKTEFLDTDLSSPSSLTPQLMKGDVCINSATTPRWHSMISDGKEPSPCSAEPCPVRVDVSLSNWLHVPVPFKVKDAGTDSAVLARQPSPGYRDLYERPILGVVNGNMNLNSVIRTVHWDGKGIPNTTTKYKEDQQVNWHASPFEARLERALNSEAKLHEGHLSVISPKRAKSFQ